jgi:hypothetical protein
MTPLILIHVPCCNNIKPQKKATNKPVEECGNSIVIPVSVLTKVNPRKMSQSIGMLWSAGN